MSINDQKSSNCFPHTTTCSPVAVDMNGRVVRRADTVGDLRSVLADPEVREALGAEVIWLTDRTLITDRAPGEYLVIPLSRLETQ